MLQTELILRAPRIDDVAVYTRYLADPAVTVWLEDSCQRPLAAKQVELFLFHDAWCRWSIAAGDQFVGVTGLDPMPAATGTARFFIVLGEKSLWARGFGTAVLRRVIEHGFFHLGLRKIVSDILEPNVASLAIHDRAGFSVEGRLREDAWRQGRWVDRILLSLLQREYLTGGGRAAAEASDRASSVLVTAG